MGKGTKKCLWCGIEYTDVEPKSLCKNNDYHVWKNTRKDISGDKIGAVIGRETRERTDQIRFDG